MMSWEFYQAYMDEAYAVLSRDWVSQKLGTSPPGLDLTALQQDVAAVSAASS